MYLLAALSVLHHAQRVELPLVPVPAHVELMAGSFALDAKTVIVANGPGAGDTADYVQSVLRPSTGFALKKVRRANDDVISMEVSPRLSIPAEGYELTVDSHSVKILASTSAGLFYGVQTFRQLLPTSIYSRSLVTRENWLVPGVKIVDAPRFGWRGLMLDVSRHFEPKPVILRFLDTMAAHKLNRFHWHLVDDPGWRIEIKKYPKLTEIGSLRNFDTFEKKAFTGDGGGGFYTQKDIREVVAYASKLHITIVPEIEMPGHSGAAIASYHELGVYNHAPAKDPWAMETDVLNVRDSTIKFYQDVLDEVMGLFPSPWIHVGGDEVGKGPWKNNPETQTLKVQRGLKDENELQSWFIKQMDHYLTSHHRRLIGWDEILEGGLAQNATVMSWRGIQGGIAAAKAGHDVVMSPTSHLYLDFYQGKPETEPRAIGGFNPLERVCSYEPIPSELTAEEAKHVLGAQGNIWTEYIPTASHMEYMAWPRGCALAELTWSPKNSKDLGSFLARMNVDVQRIGALGVNYRKITAVAPEVSRLSD